MNKLYNRIDWVNNTTPALNETNLNLMSKGIDDIDDRVVLIAGNILVTVPQLQEMLEDCTELEQRLEAMTGNPPYIGENGHWYTWDTDTGAYVDSGIDASITVQIADITMLEPNATPYVTNTGTDTDPIFHLFIPRGQPGKGISSIAKTGTSGYVDTYTITYTDGTTTTYTVTNGRNTDQVSTISTASATLVGTIYQYIGESTSSYTHGFYYECVNDGGVYKWVNIPVGNDPVEVSNSDPYIYRQGKGYLADIEIDGASVGWNQLVANSGTVSVTVPSGHKYLSKISGSWSISQSSGTAISSLAGGTDMIIDLTLLFGSTIADAIYAMETATAGAGVALFRKYFPKDYYAYDPGSVQSVSAGSRKVTGKNLYDITDSLAGSRTTLNGSYGFTNTVTDSKTSISLIISYSTIADSSSASQYVNLVNTGGIGVGHKNYNITLPDNVKMLRIGHQGTTNNLYVYTRFQKGGNFVVSLDITSATPTIVGGVNFDNIMVRLANVEDSTFEPYTSTTYPFDSTKELRGLFSLEGGELKASGDIYTADGNIQRKYGIVDLGTLTWAYNNVRFNATLTGVSLKADRNKGITSKYITFNGDVSDAPDKSLIFGGVNNPSIYIKDSTYTDAATFKTAMSGVYLVYELATPTTESAQPYQNPQRAYIDGTEEFTDGLTRDVMIPVGNNTTYQQDKILPSVADYVDGIIDTKTDISAIATEENGATASKAYTTGQHFYKDGKFCTAIANIASNAAFTLNTNYVEGTIAEAIEGKKAVLDIDPSAATISAYAVGTMYIVTQ